MGALWIPISLLAACMQVARTGMQKSLKADLDDWSVTWVRSGFALPLAALYAWGLDAAGFGVSAGLAAAGVGFWAYCGLAALSQTVATAMLVALFSHRNFAASTAFSKTEAPQIALLGFLIFGEDISILGGAGVALGFGGVLLMMTGGNFREIGRTGASGWLGLGAGFFFALTALFIRRAYGEVGGAADALGVSALALLAVIGMQALGLGAWLLLFRPGAFGRIWNRRGQCFWVGLTSVLGSACWFAAFALAHPAYVKTLSQVEMPLAWLVGRRAFRERPRGAEFAGMALVGAGATAAAFAGWRGQGD